jgi:RNA polymerase sigma-70 factor (ECF subfamily)
LVRRVLDGETALFEMLFHRHSQRIYRTARAILRDDEEAGDVVQETFLRAFRHLDQFAGRARFSTWLTKIAVYEARARARRRRTREVGPRKSAAPKKREERAIGPEQERRVLVRETRTMLEAAIDALPSLYRTVFVMKEVEEMSVAEVAACLNLSVEAVKARLRRARILLRKKLFTRAGPVGREAFRFAGRRCERMWEEELRPAIYTRARRLRR